MSRALDASSVIYAWVNYPEKQFPALWAWLAGEIAAKRLVIAIVAHGEVKKRAEDCCAWLDQAGVRRLPATNEILQKAVEIKGLLEIQSDRYHPKGVGENDIIIIATCAVEGLDLVSNEGRQNQLPEVKAKRKIPAVCNMPEVAVPCIDFLELIRTSGQVF